MDVKRSNLQCFLDSITPTVVARYIYKPPPTRNGAPWHWYWGEKEFVEYFTLSELWGSLSEWSAFGASTDVVLPSGGTAVQYFAPYLSAIQLYTIDMSMIASRNFALHNGRYWYGNEYYNPEASQSSNALPIDFRKMNLGNSEKNLGIKYFEYFENSSPYTRMPLVDKVRELAQDVPGLRNLTSVDLSPSSWMSIAWFPIYTIPAQLDRDKHSSCFLTYHRLSTWPSDTVETSEAVTELADRKGKGLLLGQNEGTGLLRNQNKGKNLLVEQNNGKGLLLDQHREKKKNSIKTMSLPPFGLACHKVNGALWNNPETGDEALAESLLCSAGSWLQNVNCYHHDFNFFVNH